MQSFITRPAASRVAPCFRECLTRRTTTPQPQQQPRSLAAFCLRRPLSIASRRVNQHTAGPCLTAIPRTTAISQCRSSHPSYSTAGTSQAATADDYIQELQDLYEIAQDELEIAAESTGAATIYATSDRATLREAFDDLDRAYAAYTGTSPPPSSSSSSSQTGAGETTANAAADVESSGVELGGGETAGSGEGGKRATNFDPGAIQPEMREEVKRRVGQRVREMRNAVEALEESAKEE